MDEKLSYLKRFSSNLELMNLSDLNEEDYNKLPEYWIEALSESTSLNKCKAILTEWEKYDYQFESTYLYMIDNLLDIDLIKQNEEISLIYSIKNASGGIAYYEGKNPLTKIISPEILKIWNDIPESFKDVYENLHNGWYYFASQSNGLSPVENLFLLDEMDWGILDSLDVKSLPFELKKSIPFFSNGMGAYVCYDLDSSDEEQGFIWYHDKSPRLDIDIWPVIDEWTKIGVEQ